MSLSRGLPQVTRRMFGTAAFVGAVAPAAGIPWSDRGHGATPPVAGAVSRRTQRASLPEARASRNRRTAAATCRAPPSTGYGGRVTISPGLARGPRPGRCCSPSPSWSTASGASDLGLDGRGRRPARRAARPRGARHHGGRPLDLALSVLLLGVDVRRRGGDDRPPGRGAGARGPGRRSRCSPGSCPSSAILLLTGTMPSDGHRAHPGRRHPHRQHDERAHPRLPPHLRGPARGARAVRGGRSRSG